MPFFSFTFPTWFKQVYPQAYANFVYNTQYLTSPFDVHKTLENILNFDVSKIGDRRQRAISLFDKVSYNTNAALHSTCTFYKYPNENKNRMYILYRYT